MHRRDLGLAFHARNCKGMVLTDDIVRALLVVGREISVAEVVAGQTLVAGDPGSFENREREAWKATHMNLVGRQTRESAERIVYANSTRGSCSSQ